MFSLLLFIIHKVLQDSKVLLESTPHMTKLEERLDWNKIYETERDSQRERDWPINWDHDKMISKAGKSQRPTLGNICIKILGTDKCKLF